MNRTNRKRCNISEARAKLPELAKFLSNHPKEVVFVEHRDLPETLAIITASHLHYLETSLLELKKMAQLPFHISGSMQSDLSDDQLEQGLAEIRKDAASKALEKFGD